MNDHLFDPEPYGGSSRKATPPVKPKPEMVPRPPGYHAVTTRNGVVGFHRTKITADLTKYGAVETWCGIVGRRVPGVFPREIVLCDECEARYAER